MIQKLNLTSTPILKLLTQIAIPSMTGSLFQTLFNLLMKLEEKFQPIKKPIMVLGTSSGAGKSLTVTAICRILKNLGEQPIPYKGQNMSNNAWVDLEGGEMAYSQALQAFAKAAKASGDILPA